MDERAGSFARHAEQVRRRLEVTGMRRAGPGSVTWKVNREIAVVAGWGRAILLQLAHPLVAAGVADHSGFRGSAFASLGRLHSTVGAMLSLTFGSDEEAVRAAAGINMIHDRVLGRLPHRAGRFEGGARYSAHDAELLRWVHLTLLDSIPLTYELLVGPLTAEERDRYCAEAAVVEPLLDIPPGFLPRRAADLRVLMDGVLNDGTIAVTDTSRALAHAVLYPSISRPLWLAFRPVQLITIGLLPPAVRDAYGFRWNRREAAALDRWVGAIRLLHRCLPRWAREWRMARRARNQQPPVPAPVHPRLTL